ncbi:hypothetical protein KP509_37G039800 [Ceratopteris richardii]|uniref:Tetraspanin-8 n=1 Tax=Ceratopteris richardii TaxID=49495 RepID=A0A8T2Q7T4_CERRI|nr:hypothetical protein KP509_37G039800 [Ceratopteris richardii]
MGLSDKLVGILNFLTFLISLPIIGAGIWLAKQHSSDCYRFLQGPVIALGVFVLLVSMAGFFGSCCRVTVLLWIYLIVMFLLIILLLVFTIFAFFVTNKTAGEIVGNKGYKEYKLGDYSTWLRRQVNKTSNWQKIESCLADSRFCDGLRNVYPTKVDFDRANLSPIQSGCCKPPTICGCSFVNATYWNNCTNSLADPDCGIYTTNSTSLCFDCNSCKAGVLQNVTKDWRKVAQINIIFLVFLIVVYAVGCCAFKNVKRRGYQKGIF